jgi:hypothetical protein
MAETWSLQSVARGGIAYLRIYGVIDETFSPTKLADAVESRDVILNVKAVSRLSSFGVREWVHAMKLLGEKARHVYLVECSPAVVQQLNMISNFAGTAQILSVQVPMICEACNWDAEAPVDMSKFVLDTLPQMACKRCGKSMVIDDLPEQYFAFANQNRGGDIDPSVQAFLHEFESAGATPDTAVTAPAPEVPPRRPLAAPVSLPTPMQPSTAPATAAADPALVTSRPRLFPLLVGLSACALIITVLVLRTRDAEPPPVVVDPQSVAAASQPSPLASPQPASQAQSQPVETPLPADQPQGKESEDVESLWQRAELLLSAGRPAEAKQALEEIVRAGKSPRLKAAKARLKLLKRPRKR